MDLKTLYPAAVNSQATTTLGALNADSVTVEVLDASVLPQAPNLLVFGTDQTAETVLMTEKNGNTLTIERAVQGNAIEWPAGTQVARNFTAKDWDDLVANVAVIVEKIMGLKAVDVGAYSTEEIDVMMEDVGGKLETHFLPFEATTEGQTVFTINLETFDAQKDTLFVIDGMGFLLPDVGYTVSARTVTMKNAWNAGDGGSFIVLRNATTEPLPSETFSGALIADGSIPSEKLAEEYVKADGSVAMTDTLVLNEKNGGTTKTKINESSGFTRITHEADSSNRGVLCIGENDILFTKIVDGTWQGDKKVFHEGNKPSGSYTGNGSLTARGVDTGGIGNKAIIQSGADKFVLITQTGAIGKNGSTLTAFSSAVCSISNGNIVFASTDTLLNENGVTYDYFVF